MCCEDELVGAGCRGIVHQVGTGPGVISQLEAVAGKCAAASSTPATPATTCMGCGAVTARMEKMEKRMDRKWRKR